MHKPEFSLSRNRKFYAFDSFNVVQSHVNQVETIEDLMQLRHDIESSATNLTSFSYGANGVYYINYLASFPSQRHVFITEETSEYYNKTFGSGFLKNIIS